MNEEVYVVEHVHQNKLNNQKIRTLNFGKKENLDQKKIALEKDQGQKSTKTVQREVEESKIQEIKKQTDTKKVTRVSDVWV